MAALAEGPVMEGEPGVVFPLETKQLLNPCSTLIYKNLKNDVVLMTSVMNDLIAEGLIERESLQSCTKNPNNFISLLTLRTNNQVEKFFVIFLRTLRGDAAAQESRRQIREEFALIYLQQLKNTLGNRPPSPAMRFHKIHGYYYEFVECLRSLLMNSEHRLESYIDYDKLSKVDATFAVARIVPDFTPI